MSRSRFTGSNLQSLPPHGACRCTTCGHKHVKYAKILASHLIEFIRGGDDVEAAELGQLELLLVDARKANLLPGLRIVRLSRGIHGFVIAAKMYKTRGEAAIVLDVKVENTCRLIVAFIV
jgi:hypothetical protein